MARDRFLGVLLLAISVALYVVTSRIDYTPMTDDPGPTLFPYFGIALLGICSIGMLLRPGAPELEPAWGRTQWLRLGKGFLPVVAYGLLLWLIGFDLATPLILVAMYWQMSKPGQFRILGAAVYAAVTFGLLYVFFHNALGSYLPEGILS
ncbi:tripartite tricarboxylate transporter TctB family protein [Salipiger mangrovisoli]|uniref:Tripartite tricarboxylate transporter TctB family protein n=1 Tax=Salipiger mangrovisoli TaxID=2865933 RepID=A0ABR9X816_9RHOB|nr:tripartite tricarboxylate transporter TctB family protein [Salipiger mangrovisoli]MBE9639650.1 tripartite tricarboxylate transporter TctB family protein [Salipiger mangrovisoli]